MKDPIKATEASGKKCTLLTKNAVEKCIWAALNDEYSANVDNDTSLRARSGLALDDTEIQDNTYDVIEKAVVAKRCKLTDFGVSQLLACETVGDIVTKVLADILGH